MKQVLRQTLAIVLAFTTAAPTLSAASNGGADLFVEAVKYLEEAQSEINCSTSTARLWAMKAQSTIGRFHGVTEAEDATAAVLRSRIAVTSQRIREHENAVNTAAKEIPKLLAAHSMGSALRALERVARNTPTCDARFQQWRHDASDRYEAASRLVREADRIVDSQPKYARKLYEDARKIDREHPELDAKIQRARNVEQRAESGGHPILKALAWTLGIVGLTAVGVYVERRQERKERERSGYAFSPR